MLHMILPNTLVLPGGGPPVGGAPAARVGRGQKQCPKSGKRKEVEVITPASTLSPPTQPTDDPEQARRFAVREAIENNRDHWGRPRIMLPDGSRETGYRRASSYGAPLEDDSQLTRWKLRQVARGVARRRAISLAITRAEVGLDGSPDAAKKAKTELNNLCEQAMEVVESGDKASIGTSLHHVCEMVDLGYDPGHVAEEWRGDIDAYVELTRGFRMLSIERFIVQDDHQVAGTTDRVVEVIWPLIAPDGTVIEPGSVLTGDLKTAQNMAFAGCKFSVQVWAYSTGVPYDPLSKQRESWGHAAPRTDWAVIFHVPSGQGRAVLHWVDLTKAAHAAEQVRLVYAWRNHRGKTLITQHASAEDFHATCASASSVAELTVAYQRALAQGAWDDALKEAFTRQRIEIESAPAVVSS